MALFPTTSGLYGGVLWSGELQGFSRHEMMPVATSCLLCATTHNAALLRASSSSPIPKPTQLAFFPVNRLIPVMSLVSRPRPPTSKPRAPSSKAAGSDCREPWLVAGGRLVAAPNPNLLPAGPALPTTELLTSHHHHMPQYVQHTSPGAWRRPAPPPGHRHAATGAWPLPPQPPARPRSSLCATCWWCAIWRTGSWVLWSGP
jgi:hypothetical protein